MARTRGGKTRATMSNRGTAPRDAPMTSADRGLQDERRTTRSATRNRQGLVDGPPRSTTASRTEGATSASQTAKGADSGEDEYSGREEEEPSEDETAPTRVGGKDPTLVRGDMWRAAIRLTPKTTISTHRADSFCAIFADTDHAEQTSTTSRSRCTDGTTYQDRSPLAVQTNR